MSWKPWLSAALLVAAGCSGGPAGQTGPTSQTGPTVVAPAEPMNERLANQARAIIELAAENEKLLARIEELNKATGQSGDDKLRATIADLRKELAGVENKKRVAEERMLDLLGQVDTLKKELADLKAQLKAPGAPAPAPAPAPPPGGKK